MEAITVRLGPRERDALDAMAQGTTRGAVIRRLIREEIEREQHRAERQRSDGSRV